MANKKRKLDADDGSARDDQPRAKRGRPRKSSTKVREPTNNSIPATRDEVKEKEQDRCVYVISKSTEADGAPPAGFVVLDVFTDTQSAVAGLKRAARQAQWWENADFSGWEQEIDSKGDLIFKAKVDNIELKASKKLVRTPSSVKPCYLKMKPSLMDEFRAFHRAHPNLI